MLGVLSKRSAGVDLAVDDPSSSQILSRTAHSEEWSSLPLRELLRLSWFYPSGFEIDRVLETRSSFLALGKSLALKFSKLPTLVHRRERLELDAAENSQLACGLYAGVLPYIVREDVPEWLSSMESPYQLPLTDELPLETADIALMMRRLRDRSRLDILLAERGELHPAYARRLASALGNFYRGQSRLREHMLLADRRLVSRLFSERLRELKERLGAELLLLPPVACRLGEECLGYLYSGFERFEERLIERALRGHFVDGHGALRTAAVFFENSTFGAKKGSTKVSILGRAQQTTRERMDDLLSDMVQLLVELKLEAQTGAYRELLLALVEEFNSEWDEDLAHWFSVYHLCQKLSIQGATGGETLQLAVREVFGLFEPAVIFIGGGKETFTSLFSATSLALPAEVISFGGPSSELSANNIESGISRIHQLLSCGEYPVIAWSELNGEERLLVSQLIGQNIQKLLVNVVSPTGGALVSPPSNARELVLPSDLPQESMVVSILSSLSTQGLVR